MATYLEQHPPRRAQYRRTRRARPTGLLVVHTAESALDKIGADSGAEKVAAFIRNRTDPGSYHDLVDSDSALQLVPYGAEAYQDGTGSNPYALSLSFACRAADWPGMDPDRREAFLRQGAGAFHRQQAWLRSNGYPSTPLVRVTRAQSAAGHAGLIGHGERDPGRRSDPGAAFPWARFLELCKTPAHAHAKTAPPAPPVAITTEGPSMLVVQAPDDARQFLCDTATATHISPGERAVLTAAGVPYVGEAHASDDARREFLTKRGAAL